MRVVEQEEDKQELKTTPEVPEVDEDRPELKMILEVPEVEEDKQELSIRDQGSIRRAMINVNQFQQQGWVH